MSRIIALQGRGNSGKTSTIRLLPDLLLAAGYWRVPGLAQDHGYDFLDVFENGVKRVGVTSCGDSFDAVHDRLTDLITAKCDECFCACRTRDNGIHGTNAAVNSFPSHPPQFLQKTYESVPARQSLVNALDASLLFSTI